MNTFRFKNWRKHWSTIKDKQMTTMAALTDLECPSNEDWYKVCETITDMVAPLVQEEVELLREIDNPAYRMDRIKDRLESGLRDNYFHMAVAAHLSGVDKSTPALAWAAFNKHSYLGYEDELSVVRYLLWSGFDASVPDRVATPLHYIAAAKAGQRRLPMFIDLLMENGADINSRNANGDTPLICLAGFEKWDTDRSMGFLHLLKSGADPTIAANDGETALSLLIRCNEMRPHDERAQLIELLESACD